MAAAAVGSASRQQRARATALIFSMLCLSYAGLIMVAAVIPTAFAFQVVGSITTVRRISCGIALQMAADNNSNENGGEKSSSSASSARQTQSLTSPVRKTDRRSPTRIISKPSANARSTITLGGDKVATEEKTATTGDESKTAPSTSASFGGGGFLGGSYSFADFKPPFAQTSVQLENGMINDGPFAWMATYTNLFGYRIGKSLVGAIPTDIKASPELTQEEISDRRAAAERDLTNISPEERGRRAEVANVALKVCGVYAIFSSLILDDGGVGGHFARFAVILPLFVYRGYDLSAKSGL